FPLYAFVSSAFVILWITEVFSNLSLVYRGYCSTLSPEYHLCNAYITTNILGWMVLISFAFTTGFSWKVYKDEKNRVYQTKEFGIETNNKMNSIPQKLQPQFWEKQ
ncbi:917_t:CDS:2, partial [Diversispora eburnea]